MNFGLTLVGVGTPEAQFCMVGQALSRRAKRAEEIFSGFLLYFTKNYSQIGARSAPKKLGGVSVQAYHDAA